MPRLRLRLRSPPTRQLGARTSIEEGLTAVRSVVHIRKAYVYAQRFANFHPLAPCWRPQLGHPGICSVFSMAGLILLPLSVAVSRRGVLGGAAAASLAAQHAAPAAHAAAAQRCVYVAGATGRTGRRVVEELLRDREFGVVAGARTEASAAKLPAGVARLVADLSGEVRGDEAELASMLRTRQVTDVVCTLGYSPTYLPEQDRKLAEAVDYLGTVRLLTACEAAALPGRFVLVSSLGVDAATDSARLLSLLATCRLLRATCPLLLATCY